jgi:hypothetical protein
MLNFVVDEILTHGVLFKVKFMFHIFSLGVTINGFFLFPLRLIYLWIFQQWVPKTTTVTYTTK